MIISNAKIPEKIIYVDYGSIAAFTGHRMTSDGSYYVNQNVCDVFEYIDEANKIKIINNANQKFAKPIKIEVIDNVPIHNLKLDCTNSNFTRCTVHGTYNVPFDQLSLLEAIKKSKVGREGKIIADFIWIKIGKQLKLVRIGSDIHSAAMNSILRRNKKKISKKELVAGNIYETCAGRRYLFVDFVDTKLFNWKRNNSISFDNTNFIVSERNNKLFFIEMRGPSEDKTFLSLIKENDFESLKYRCRVQDNHSFVHMVGKLNLPKYFISNFRNYYRDLMKQYFIEVSSGKISKRYISNYLISYSKYFNLKKNKEVIADFEYKKYLAFL